MTGVHHCLDGEEIVLRFRLCNQPPLLVVMKAVGGCQLMNLWILNFSSVLI